MHVIGGNSKNDDELTDVEIRPTRREDFDFLCGKQPPSTCQALTVVYRGEVVALAGVTLTRYGYTMCMHLRENIDAPKIKVWRYAKRMMSMIAQGKSVLYASLSNEYPNSCKFLTKLGFKYYLQDTDGSEIFIWQASA